MSETITTAIGRVQPIFKGNYNPSVTYQKLDNVFYQGETWVSLINNPLNAPPSNLDANEEWQKVAAQGSTGSFAEPEGQASTLPAGSSATVNITATGPDTNKTFSFNFGIPKGDQGDVGITSVEAEATNLKQDGVTPLTAYDDPWVEVALNTGTQLMSMTLGIPPGHDGEGAVSSVDGYGATAGNVQLYAVQYGRSQNITAAQATQARTNINAQIAGNYIEYLPSTSDKNKALIYNEDGEWATTSLNYIGVPVSKIQGQYLQNNGNNEWITADVDAFPPNGAVGQALVRINNGVEWQYGLLPTGGVAGDILMKTGSAASAANMSWFNMSAISSGEINQLFAN